MYTIIKENKGNNARFGVLKTQHGEIETPFFMPVATRSSGKYIGTDDYENIGVNAIISNALVNFFKPGLEIINNANGIHKFMNFKGVVFTDSGGFQMSRSIYEETSKRGVWFRNPFNKQKVIITPEKSMIIQLVLGSDVAMVLDFMPPINSSYDSVEKSLVLTHRWAEEALRKHSLLRKENVIEIKDKIRVMKYNVNNKNQLLFAISQGGLHKELRMKSAEYLSSLKINGREFDGIAIGGLAIGEKQKDMLNMIESATSKIPKNKIRYLMGVGNPLDIIEAVERGIDAFDSIYPTRNARHGTIFTWKGKIDLMSGKYSNDFSPIEEGCKCDTCKRYTKAYLHHLLKINEPIGKKYVQHHNIYFMLDFMRKIRESIKNDKFREFKREFIKMWSKNKT